MYNDNNEALCLRMVRIDHCNFAAEILQGNVRVNLTQMAKPFRKRVSDWLRTDSAQEYLEAVALQQKCVTADLLEVRYGGLPEMQGTWCNDRRIALRFAQWLDVRFAVAVDTILLKLIFGEAVFAEPINGVEPVISGGRAWYNYRDAQSSFGLSRKSSASRRKAAMPQCFNMLYGRNFITKEYFLTLQSYHSWREQCRQLTFDFSGGEVSL
ncbi:KilA-N domain-containing protein [Muribaculum intestinale]|jgi:hypothetical protein|uniref:KilA-N domain-containing protein n=1 Tax=Muribaculum intestinale TaxID=1796646 RepID=A0A4S2FJE1_9BACT|nr:KilA-N domain-containing protein [Muribaculum intestinale]MYM11537.1 hypothetical protein [Muribaculum intestinale]ROT09080.1 KilA-N domain-containing protein [Muribaculaceae bacterium Isolate-100 (HZI)]RXE64446.1 KilA-N domain-containing protein [Muribaculaceae bacterium Isolate-007 (NCI)]TGY68972.1 KilA-N domain-containing protein [Muribaculum intestinale]